MLNGDYSHSALNLTKVNTWGLVYEWKGTDSALKPLLLAAHQGEFRVQRVYDISSLTAYFRRCSR